MKALLFYNCPSNISEVLKNDFRGYEIKVVESINEAKGIAKSCAHSVFVTAFFLSKINVFSKWEQLTSDISESFDTALFFEPDYESDEFLQAEGFRNFHFLFDSNINSEKVKFSSFLNNSKFISVSRYGFQPEVSSGAYWIVNDSSPRNSFPGAGGAKRECVFKRDIFEYACFVFEGYNTTNLSYRSLIFKEKRVINSPFHFLPHDGEVNLSESGEVIYQTPAGQVFPSSEARGFGVVSPKWEKLLKIQPMDFKIAYASKGVSSGNGCLSIDGKWVVESEYLARYIYGAGHHERGLSSFSNVKNLTIPAVHAWVSVGYNYYHWVAQIVPFLYKISEIFREKEIEEFCIIVGNIYKFHEEYIRNIFYDFKKVSILSLQAYECVNANQGIYYGNSVGGETYVSNFSEQLEAASFLKKRVQNTVGKNYPEKIYISRKDSPHRRMQNEDELMVALSERGYTSVTLTGLSVAEQISIFENAKYIIAPHGAGVTNIVYCAPHTRVLEFYCLQNHHDTGQICMAKIAQCVSVDYASFFMQENDNLIEIDKLMKALEEFKM